MCRADEDARDHCDPNVSSGHGAVDFASLCERALSLINPFETVRLENLNARTNLLRPVYRNGELFIDESLESIRRRAQHNRSEV